MQAIEKHGIQIKEELNIKAVEFVSADDQLVSYQVKPNFPRLGKRYGKMMPAIKQALVEADGASLAQELKVNGGFSLEIDGQKIDFEPEDCQVHTSSAEGYASAGANGFMVALDTSLSAELVLEGIAREIVRTVQDARKSADLEISDRIVLGISGSELVEQAIAIHGDYIKTETLADSMVSADKVDGHRSEKTLEDQHWAISLRKI